MSERSRKGIVWPSKLDAALVYGGITVALFQAAWIADADPLMEPFETRQLQIGVVVLGLLANQFGPWRGVARLSPRRKYLALRSEVDRFLDLVRQLSASVVDRDEAAVEKVASQMREAVDVIVTVAGVEMTPDGLEVVRAERMSECSGEPPEASK